LKGDITMVKCGKCPICKLIGFLLILGAVNWGLVGAFNLNIVQSVLGGTPIAEKIVYILIGLSGLAGVAMCFKTCPCANK
jgi:uncharacterized membrane protein YuzA (DUF378 family)